MEYFIGGLVIAWVIYIIYQGYQDETAPPLTMKDDGHGIMVPVCARCSARLVTVDRKAPGGMRYIVGALLIVLGVASILFNIAAGIILMIVGALLVWWGKPTIRVLSCPACGTDAKILR